MLVFMRSVILFDNKLATDFIILCPISSNPIALPESNAIIKEDTCSGVIVGILKYISFSTLLFTKFVSSVISASRRSLYLLPKISEMEEKYSFILVAISSEDVYPSLFMIISSGKLRFELLSLLLILRKCCHTALVSFKFITESEKCLRLLSLSNLFKLSYCDIFYNLTIVFSIYNHRVIYAREQFYHYTKSGNFLDLTRLVL